MYQRFLFCYATFVYEPKDLLIQIGQSRNGTEEARSSKSLALPIKTQIAHNRAEPGGEFRRAIRCETAQSPELRFAQALANELETISSVITA